MEKAGYVYIMASARNGTIYIGVTSDLPKRIWEHRNDVVPASPANTGVTCWSGTKRMVGSKRREHENGG